MCEVCDKLSLERKIFVDDKGYYFDYVTGEWDDKTDDFVHEKLYMRHCLNCGRKLSKGDDKSGAGLQR